MFQQSFKFLLAASLLLALNVAVTAQDSQNNNGGGGNADADSPQIATVDNSGQFPDAPFMFQRGSQVLSSDGPQGAFVGLYFSMFRFSIVLILVGVWVKSAAWVHEDSKSLKIRNSFWNAVISATGFVGILVAICMPAFILTFGLLALSVIVPLGIYVQERNGTVPASSKVMTPDHLKKVGIRTLSRIGIKVGSTKTKARALGPEITFLGKSSTGSGDNVSYNRKVESSKGYLAAREMIYDAISRRATDVHLEPSDDAFNVRMRVDGVMHRTDPFDRAVGEAVVNILKVLGAMDITEKRKPQDGSFRAETEGKEIDFRVATQGTRQGEKISIRILDQSAIVGTLAGLGMRKQLQENLRKIVHLPHGLQLVCGPTGAGKSTSLYACLSEIDAFQRNIITVEDPIEYKMSNVTQIEINQKAGQTFAGSLRSILRQDPDVVMLGEIRDAETATIACQAANTGHMVFSTIHANDSFTALNRIIDLGVETFVLSDSLSAILAQRLVRRLCPDCKTAYKPKPEFLKQANLPAEKIEKFYRPPKQYEEPCETCGNYGFHGRIGVYELLEITDRMRDLIRENAAVSAIKAEARKNGMLYMKEEGLRLVVRGVTSVDELLRVVK